MYTASYNVAIARSTAHSSRPRMTAYTTRDEADYR